MGAAKKLNIEEYSPLDDDLHRQCYEVTLGALSVSDMGSCGIAVEGGDDNFS